MFLLYRSLPFSSAGSYENRAFVQETSSIYSEHYYHTQEFQTPQTTTVPKLPIAVKDSPKFDVHVRVKRAPPPPPSPLTSDTESVATSRHDRNLSTIMETHEDRESVLTIDSLPQDVSQTQFTYVPELHTAPKRQSPPPPPPVFSVYTKHHEVVSMIRKFFFFKIITNEFSTA